MTIHEKMADVHVPYRWEYDDAAARLAATGFTIETDFGKLALQKDNNSLWMLIDYDEVYGADWVGIGSASAVHLDEAGEFATVSEKETPVAGDKLLIEDSEDGNAKKWVDWDNLPSGGGGVSYDFILIQDQKTQGTYGGSASSGSWNTRNINTEVIDTGNNVSLSSNQMSLAAGTYIILNGWSKFYVTGNTAVQLYNVTDSVVLTDPISDFVTGYANYSQVLIPIVGGFTIEDTKTIEIQYKCGNNRNTDGLGLYNNLAKEVYTSLFLMKIA